MIDYNSKNYKTCKHCKARINKNCINKINSNNFINYNNKYNNKCLCDNCIYDLNILYKTK